MGRFLVDFYSPSGEVGVFEMLALMTTALASGTALWIAYYVYPIQKKKDRELKLQEEKATVYRAFFDAANNYYEGLKKGWREDNLEGFDASYPDLVKAQEALMLYAPGKAIEDCKAYTSALFEYRAHVRLEKGEVKLPPKMKATSRGHAYHLAEGARSNALVRVRVDLWGCSEQEAQRAVTGLYPTVDEADRA